jgi:hypothetical protein
MEKENFYQKIPEANKILKMFYEAYTILLILAKVLNL